MKLYTKLFLCCLALFSGACSSWLDIEPEGEATSEKLFKTGDGYRSVLSGIYKAMTSKNLYGVELQFGLVDCISQQYTWDWDYSMGATTGTNIYREARSYNYTNADLKALIDKIWADGYNVVANANNLIQNVQNASPDLFAGGEAERTMILGEAYACRALMHFDLCRLFAPAPVENEGGSYLPYVDSYPNIQPMSIEVKPFLDKVIADLNTALDLTSEFDLSPLGQSMNTSGETRFGGLVEYGMEGYQADAQIDDFYKGRGFRLNYYSITALMARVYQYMGEDKLAFDCAKKVLEFKATDKNGSEKEMFTADEWWNIMTDKIENRTDLKVKSNLLFALFNDMAYEDYNLEVYFRKEVSDRNTGQWFVADLANQEIFKNPSTGDDELENDYRGKYLLFTPTYSDFSWNPRYISAKWYCSNDLQVREANTEILPVIRATEMRYIMAEHYAREGNFTEAYSILNEIRSNRGMWEPLSEATTLDGFFRDMIRDAQREWFSEGQLFYLYKRLGTAIRIGQQVRKMTKAEYMFPIPENQNM